MKSISVSFHIFSDFSLFCLRILCRCVCFGLRCYRWTSAVIDPLKIKNSCKPSGVMAQILIHPVTVHILITAPQILVCDLRFCAADIHTAKIYKSLFFQYLIHRICLVIRFPSMAVRAGWIKQDRYIPHKCSHTFAPFARSADTASASLP